MNSTWYNAPAKINLGLDVLRKREDGYHDVRMIMQSIRLFDRLTLTKKNNSKISLSTNLWFLPCNEHNLVYRAANMLIKEFKISSGVDIFLEKRIPVSAGMAGGSTDAAACLLAMNRLFELNLSDDELMERGVALGADIPYCIMKGTALSEGIGEQLTQLTPAPDCFVLIAKPNIHVSTKFVYSNLHLDEKTIHPNIDAILEAIETKNVKQLADNMGNVLEAVTIPHHPEINKIKETMLEFGALNSLMSGSGPTVFGIFDNENDCIQAKDACRKLPYKCFVFTTDFYR